MRTGRAGWQSLRESLAALALVAGANPGNPAVKTALDLLQEEAQAVLRSEPGLAANGEIETPPAVIEAPAAPVAPAVDSPTTATQPAPAAPAAAVDDAPTTPTKPVPASATP
jgi:hypothetical protein